MELKFWQYSRITFIFSWLKYREVLYYILGKIVHFPLKPQILVQAHPNFSTPYFSFICTSLQTLWHPSTFSNSWVEQKLFFEAVAPGLSGDPLNSAKRVKKCRAANCIKLNNFIGQDHTIFSEPKIYHKIKARFQILVTKFYTKFHDITMQANPSKPVDE